MATAMFPHLIADDVYFCGYHSEASFGATSYFIRRPWGNVLVDSPRFAAPLVRRLEELGGISHLVLTHVDDVADHQKFRDHFDCVRVMHRGDYREQLAGVELWLDGSESVSLAPGFTLWPSPGHTEGSICLHVEDKFLFTGDTLAWQRDWEQVYAFRRACWYDWSILVDSVERLKALPFRWLLPGHGAPIELAEGTSSVEMQRCLDWMRTHGS
jgi:glyoxylase-like metal-dependent hydrolase (beta-lactamase superfamily II)